MNGISKPKTVSLKPGQSAPSGEPKRYLNDRGYVRLRWLVGPNEYIEAYEHRLVMGMPASDLEVHHINGVKSDNRPENLVVLNKSDHAILHASYAPTMYHGKPRQPLTEYPTCSEFDCYRPAQCVDRTLCLMHYKRLNKHGSTALLVRGKTRDNAQIQQTA